MLQQFVKTANDSTIYGEMNGQWYGFQDWNQLLQANGGQAPQISTVKTAPTGSTPYDQYLKQQQQNATPPPGIDPTLYNSLSPADKAFVQSLNTIAKDTYTQGSANYSINAQTMQKALELAQNDPTIKAIYGDQAKMALSDLHNNLGYISKEYAQQFGLTTAEQTLARKQLSESEAAAGRAYSGFRTQAESLQKQQQQAVIQSSQRQLQQQVRQIGSQYESQFGSANLPSISAGGQTYQPYGGVTGSQVTGEQQAIQQKQTQEYQTISNPLTQQ